MVAAEELHCGDVHHRKAAWLRDAEHFGDGGGLIALRKRIQHIEGGDDVKGIARKGKRRYSGPSQARASGLSADFESESCQVEPESASKLSEQLQIVAGAAAAIEKKGVVAAFGGLTEQRGDEQAEATKPEMPRLGTIGLLQHAVHGLNFMVLCPHLFD